MIYIFVDLIQETIQVKQNVIVSNKIRWFIHGTFPVEVAEEERAAVKGQRHQGCSLKKTPSQSTNLSNLHWMHWCHEAILTQLRMWSECFSKTRGW